MKVDELTALGDEQLVHKELELERSLLGHTFRHRLGQLENTSVIKTIRRDIARAQTLLGARERAGGLGGVAQGTVQVATQNSFLVPYDLGLAEENQHVFAVAGSLAAFGQSVREASTKCAAFGDADTADLFTEMSRGIDQQLWFVESHVAPSA
jgi:ribosomal protein L29